jgi:hypothetical protein
MLGSLYLLMALMLVAGSLIARRERFAKLMTFALAWIVILDRDFRGRIRPFYIPGRSRLRRATPEVGSER